MLVPLTYNIFQLHLQQRVPNLSTSVSHHRPAETLNFPISVPYERKLAQVHYTQGRPKEWGWGEHKSREISPGATPSFLLWKSSCVAYSTQFLTGPTVGLSLSWPQVSNNICSHLSSFFISSSLFLPYFCFLTLTFS